VSRATQSKTGEHLMRLALPLFFLMASYVGSAAAQGTFEHSNYKPLPLAQILGMPVPAKETRLFEHDRLFRINAFYTGDTRQLDFPRHPLIPAWLNSRSLEGMSPKGLTKELRIESEGRSFWAPIIMVVSPDKGEGFAIRRRSVVYLHQIGNLNGQPYFLAIVGSSQSR
jgi:hypothetical protein